MYRNFFMPFMMILIFISCDEESEPVARFELTGEWRNVLSYVGGYEEQILDIENDSSIVIHYSLFGIQPETAPDQLNAEIYYYGDLQVDRNQVNFEIYEYVYTDYYLDIGPDTLANQTVFFDQSTYNIVGDTLILNYTSYPADIPVESIRKFARVN